MLSKAVLFAPDHDDPRAQSPPFCLSFAGTTIRSPLKTILGLCVLKWRDKNGSFFHFCLCGDLHEIGLFWEARGRRFHTVLHKLQRKGFFVPTGYRDAKNVIFSSNSGKRRLFMKGK